MARQIHFDTNNDIKNTVFLAGSGRGGTTWIAEIINHKNDYRFIFEPFYAQMMPLCKDFRNRQYIRPDDRNPVFLEPAEKILSGRFHNAWTDYYNRRVVSAKRLVKDIRASLFLKWIHRQFPDVPIVLLIRHPFAVVHSRTVLNWHDDLTDLLDQKDLMSDYLVPYERYLRSSKDTFDRHLIRWCVENFVPLEQFGSSELHVAYYEEFCERPKEAIGRLFSYLGLSIDGRLFENLRRPSSQLYADRPHAGWRKTITPAQAERGLGILHAFGLDRLYTREGYPNLSAISGLQKR